MIAKTPTRSRGALVHRIGSSHPGLYGPEDIKAWISSGHRVSSQFRSSGQPGDWYRGKYWTFACSPAWETPKTNERWHLLLKEGQTGLSTAFDFPTLMGMTPIHQRPAENAGSAASHRHLRISPAVEASPWTR